MNGHKRSHRHCFRCLHKDSYEIGPGCFERVYEEAL